MDADLDTLATALYVTIDDLLRMAPWRPAIGFSPQISDAELVTLAVMQALLGFTSESRWLRFATAHLHHLFPYRPSTCCAAIHRARNRGFYPATRHVIICMTM